MIFFDENNIKINNQRLEAEEQYLVLTYVEENDVVLELGARYGTVSCAINYKLNNKTNQVSVEPDDRVWDALENNKKNNNCHFNIIKGFISNNKLGLINKDVHFGGYGTSSIVDNESTIDSFTLDDINLKYNLKFNVLVADCEGFLETFIDENSDFCKNLRMCIFEADYPNNCNYPKIRQYLESLNFKKIKGDYQNVYVKNN
jgi:FkbM family methyltransferase